MQSFVCSAQNPTRLRLDGMLKIKTCPRRNHCGPSVHEREFDGLGLIRVMQHPGAQHLGRGQGL